MVTSWMLMLPDAKGVKEDGGTFEEHGRAFG